MLRFRWPRASLFFQWPVIVRKRPPKGVCDDCHGQGEYMVMRPGMVVPCGECNPVSAEVLHTESTTTTTFIPTAGEAEIWPVDD